MDQCCGARNTIGFSSLLQQGTLPPETHLTYEGVFNEIKYNVGPRTQKIIDLHSGYSRFQFKESKFDSQMNDYLAIFLKSKFDGQDRSQSLNMNISICLDVSGSMELGLGSAKSGKTRLSLAVQAIKMLISKLKPKDSVSLVIFESQSQVVIQQTLKGQITSDIYERLDCIFAQGGTTIINGFQKSSQELKKWLGSHKKQKSENRIVMLTDVGDDSFRDCKSIVQSYAEKDGIHTTIIGISTDFKSQICEHFKDVKGFNYFCAVQETDLKKYVFQTFDFGFFPTAQNITLQLQSPGIANIEVFGTPDSNQIKTYRQNTKDQNVWTITRLKSSFPSEIQIHGDTVFTVGGLILVKMQRKGPSSYFNAVLNLSYQSIQGEPFQEKYPLNFQFHPLQQFFSGEQLREAIEGYVFTSELKQVLKTCKGKTKSQIWSDYWPIVCNLDLLCPKSKQKQLEKIKKIIKSYESESAKK